mgnify:CR=1 FL=1
MRNNVVKKVLAATLACMMTFSMTTVAQAKGDKKSDKEITIGVTSFADTLEPTEQYFSWVVSRYAIGECLTKFDENGEIVPCLAEEWENSDDGKTWTMLPEGSTVSMNMWGFTESILTELERRFTAFLTKNLPVNPLTCEYFLPFVVDELLKEKKATVKVLTTQDKWYGVTYKEDKPVVVAAIQKLKDQGLYPQGLWD